MTTATTNLLLNKGANYTATLTLTNSNGSSFNLWAYTPKAQLRRNFESANAVTFTSTKSDAANGEITIALTHAQTEALKSGHYVYDVMIYDTANATTRILEGMATISERVTVQW